MGKGRADDEKPTAVTAGSEVHEPRREGGDPLEKFSFWCFSLLCFICMRHVVCAYVFSVLLSHLSLEHESTRRYDVKKSKKNRVSSDHG
jgi:hypothetical protein